MSRLENKADESGLIDFAEVRQRVSLKAFVESCGVHLQRDGNNFRGKCPLHNEQHGASLILYPDERWYCHGKCKRGGDVVDFARAISGENREETVRKLLGGEPIPRYNNQSTVTPARIIEPKWPARDFEKIRKITSWAARGLGVSFLQKQSPFRFASPEQQDAEKVIGIIFPGDPILCCGWTPFKFHSWPREVWRGRLADLQFIVPNPMYEPVGLTKSGRWSEHAQSAVARRVYLVIEFDFSEFERDNVTPTQWQPLIQEWKSAGVSVADACVALHLHLAEELPLVMVVSSGGRSVHGWYYAFNPLSDDETGCWRFMRHAYSIGADHVTWNRAQFVRMACGLRSNGVRQSLIYLDPGKAINDAP